MSRRRKLKTPADVQHEFFMDVMDYMDGLISMDELEAKYSDGSDYWKRMQDEHGALVDIEHGGYHDIMTYEDGFREWVYIGD